MNAGRQYPYTAYGGSGLVVVAYPNTFRNLTVSGGLAFTLDIDTRSGFKVYKFTSGTGTVNW
jgi:hypothetical protein